MFTAWCFSPVVAVLVASISFGGLVLWLITGGITLPPWRWDEE